MRRLVSFIAAALFALSNAALAQSGPGFNAHIRPILSDNCFKCHGPDAGRRKAELRLDLRDVAVAKGAIVPGDAPASELVRRITSADPNVHMPPPDSGLALTGEQIARLTAWINSGAAYEPFWAFVPPRTAGPPTPDDPARWARNAIDHFVLERLNREGIAPAIEADKESLLRRLTFDLTGLPPTLDELDAFLADSRPQAYEDAVDRLLGSPHFGERMAADWLDLARYADTFGYQNDRENNVWPWRDWVVRAFNTNLPYDQFITWQIAGDMLPEATQDQILATAFNRLHRQTNEGGSVLEEFRVEYVCDRTNTFGTAFLGMTFECARCHDHKFDPVSQRDYYALSAFFANIDESGMYSHFTDAVPSPSLLLYPNDTVREEHARLKSAIAEGELALEQARMAARDHVRAGQIDAPPHPAFALDFEDARALGKPEDEAQPWAEVQGAEIAPLRGGSAILFNGDNGLALHKVGKFERTEPFTVAAWLRAPSNVTRAVVFHRSMAAEDAANRGYECVIEDNRITFSLCHFWPGNAIRVRALQSIPADTWFHLALTYDGSSRAEGMRIYLDGLRIDTETVRDGLFKTIRYGEGDDPPLVFGARFRDQGFRNGAADDIAVFDRELTALEVAAIAGKSVETLTHADRIDHAVERNVEEVSAKRDALREARRAESAFIEGIREIMVMREMPEPRQAYVLDRGSYERRKDPVAPATPEAILPFPDEYPRNRLGLAQWLADRRNPLVARVAVNRFWQLFWGRGIVATPEDFGSQGAPPDHPELLDYLAVWFMDSRWDVKALCRLIVTSAAYRQSAAYRPDLAERDPANVLLARGPATRLGYEQIRDAALAASGLLVPDVGGPGVKPYQPDGLWKEASSIEYTPDSGAGLYRRTLYTFWKRTVPPPSMLSFDAPTREFCVARRERTATPLQALILLNDPQYVEAARALAASAIKTAGSDPDRAACIFRKLTSRFPSASEMEIMLEALAAQRAFFAPDPEAARAYVETGDSPVPENADPPQLAAWTAIAQLVMNFEEFSYK